MKSAPHSTTRVTRLSLLNHWCSQDTDVIRCTLKLVVFHRKRDFYIVNLCLIPQVFIQSYKGSKTFLILASFARKKFTHEGFVYSRSRWVVMGSVGRMGSMGRRGQHLIARPCKAHGIINADYCTDSAKRQAATTQTNARPLTHSTHSTHNYPFYPQTARLTTHSTQ